MSAATRVSKGTEVDLGGQTGRRERAVREFVDRVATTYGATTVMMASREALGGAQPSDLVVSMHAETQAEDWDGYLRSIAVLARKVLVVVGPNLERVGARGRVDDPFETVRIAPILWSVGRVREHAYLDVPRLVARLAGAEQRGTRLDVVQAPAGALVRRAAPLHAFVVDTAPRSPQARRRLRAVVGASGEGL
jgi:hypothetical protein